MSRNPRGYAAVRPHVGGERLTRRERDAIVLIAKSKTGLVTDEQLRRVVGRYATNAIKALERRRLIIEQMELEYSAPGAWLLTERGHALVQALADLLL